IDVSQPRSCRKRRAVDAVNTRASHLNEPQSCCRTAHCGCEPHRHQYVRIAQEWNDIFLVGDDDVARNIQMTAHRLFEAGGKGAGDRDLKKVSFLSLSEGYGWLTPGGISFPPKGMGPPGVPPLSSC